MKNTQIEKVIRLMARRPDQEWFNAIDFQKPGLDRDVYIGYEASARISDVMRLYPGAVDVKRDGKYRYIKLAPISDILKNSTVPEEIKKIIKAERPQFNPPTQAPLFDMPPQRRQII